MTFDELVERLDDLTSVSLHDVSKESLVADLGWDSLDLTVAYFLIIYVRPD
jgi:hypothetical protein